MVDFTFSPVGRLVTLAPRTDRARSFADARWPYGAPNTCRSIAGGQLLGRGDFETALVAIADAGLEAASRSHVLVEEVAR